MPARSLCLGGVLAAVVATALLPGCGGGDKAATRPPTTAARQQFDCPAQTPGARVVTIFHETHTHGHLAGTHERDRNVLFARYVGLRNALRSCLREPDSSLFVGNGDDLSIDLNGVITEGEHTIEAFNAAGLDVNTFGFSEVEFHGVLRARVAASEFIWVSANMRDAKTRGLFAAEQGARPWVIEDVGGVRLGITGLIGQTFSGDYPPILPPEAREDVFIVDPVRAMGEAVREMRAAGADVVILLSHMLHEDTLRVVRSVDGIDAALGTHLGPPTLEADIVNGAIVAVAGPDELQGLGQLDLVIERGRVVDFVWHRHIPSPSDPIAADVQAVVDEYLRAD